MVHGTTLLVIIDCSSGCGRTTKVAPDDVLGFVKMKKMVMGVLGMSMSMNIANAQFTPVIYQSQTPDYYSIMSRSLKQQEDRSTAAHQKYSELAQLIGEKRMKISNDRETLEWFSDNINSKLEDVKSSLDVRDYAGARELAEEAIGEIQSDIQLMRRIQTYEEYKRVVQSIQDRTDLTYQQKQEWYDTYRYKFVPIRDYLGKVIGAYDWMEIGGPNNTRVIIP